MMRFILNPVGSSGDVHPFVGLVRELKRLGHDVTLVAFEPFLELADQAGLGFASIMSTEDFKRLVQHPDLWHPLKGVRFLLRTLGDNMRSTYDVLSEVYERGSVIVGHPISFAARVLEEVHDAPGVTIHLAPSTIRSVERLPAVSPGWDADRLPTPLKRALVWLVDRLLADPCIEPALNAWRRDLGLPAVSRPFKSWLNSPRRVIGLFPDWFADRPSDWPNTMRLTGFPLFDEAPNHELSPELEAFLDRGSPPIVFTPGSANAQATRFFEAAVDATTRLGRRALFLTRYPEQVPHDLPEHTRWEAYIPLSLVLSRSAALVHHGGVGTLAQGFAAGVPQLVMPMAFDQPDNASRLERLRVGSWLRPHHFTGPRVAAKLARLLDDRGIHAACQRWKESIAMATPLEATCDLIEESATVRV